MIIATVLMPLATMCFTTAALNTLSSGGVLKIHLRFASTGDVIWAAEANVIMGVLDSATGSITPKAQVLIAGPRIRSTLSCVMRRFTFCTAVVLSEASSYTTTRTFCPAITAGAKTNAFFSGMPMGAPGPVEERSTPIVICA